MSSFGMPGVFTKGGPGARMYDSFLSGTDTSMVADWALAFASILATSEAVLRATSQAVLRQNQRVDEQVKKMNVYEDAKSAVANLLGKFSPQAENDAKLGDAEDKGGSIPDSLSKLNKALVDLGFTDDPNKWTKDNTKGDFEALRTTLDGKSQTLGTEQNLQSTRMNSMVGRMSADMTQQSNIVKAEGNLLMNVARNSG
ncbi:hypothetical protein [Bordetella genomosp. 9]|nr:hypothetical protein [Bordetella genomosp. 9]